MRRRPGSSGRRDAARGPCAGGVARWERVQPDRDAIIRLVQLRPECDSHQRWIETLDRLLATLPRLLRPRAVYRVDRVARLDPQRIVLASGPTYVGAVGAYLEHSEYVASFIVTIGSATERLSRGWLRAGRVVAGTIADAIASEAAEATVQRLRDEVRSWAQARGMDVTPAYSPGYCGLDLRQQEVLFAALPARAINVRLTPSCLMLPLKSVSGLIGIGPPGRIRPDRYACSGCDHPNCPQRRAPFDATPSA